eukprot:5232001-Pleurochrysis_carterae.AAC.1
MVSFTNVVRGRIFYSICGSPAGGSESKAGCGGIPAALIPAQGVDDHGKQVSSKYTSDVTTARRPGTKTLKAPGECGFRP